MPAKDTPFPGPSSEPLPSPDPRLVVAGILERDGKILIGQRKRNASHALKWEFPGGKVEAGEAPRAAIVRELEEELGIQAEVGDEIDSYLIRYGDGPLTRLIFYRIPSFAGEPRNLDFEQIRWESPENFARYDFLEGDRQFIDRLAAGSH